MQRPLSPPLGRAISSDSICRLTVPHLGEQPLKRITSIVRCCYGHPEREPWVQFVFDDVENQLTLNVCNVAHPTAPHITPEMASNILQGGKGSSPNIDLRSSSNMAIRTSDGIGLMNARKAIQTIGGKLCLSQDTINSERITNMEIRVPFQCVDDPHVTVSFSPIPPQATPMDASVDASVQQFKSNRGSARIKSNHGSTAFGPKCFSLDDLPSLLRMYDIGCTINSLAQDIIMGRKSKWLQP